MVPRQPEPPVTLIVIGGLENGGSERQMTELVVRAHPTRLRTTVVVLRREEATENRRRLDAAGIPVTCVGVRVPVLGGLVRACRLALVIRRTRPDVVYAWLEESSVVVVPLARLMGVPVVVARRNVAGARRERIAAVSWVIRQVEARADLVTANSAAALESARTRGIRPDRLRLVPNGHADLPRLAVPSAPPVVLGYLARFRAEKGHHRLLEALEEVRARSPWIVLLGGDGALLEATRREVVARGLSDRVVFEGDVTDSRAFWARTHVAVLLSDHEGSPNALLEGAAAGRPLVATATGGTPELVVPAAGLLVPLDPPETIASALTSIIDDPALRQQLGDGAHEVAVRHFGMQACVDAHVAVLEAAARATPSVALPT